MKHLRKYVYAALLTSGLIATASAEAPAFNTEPIEADMGIGGEVYAGTLAGSAIDPDGGSIYYIKESGPDWLNVAPDGTLSGIAKGSNEPWSIIAFNAEGYDRATLDIPIFYTGLLLPIEDMTVVASADNRAAVELVCIGAHPGDICTWYKEGGLLGTGISITANLPVGEHQLVLRQYNIDFEFTVTVLYGVGGPLSIDAGADIEMVADPAGIATVDLSAWTTGPVESTLWKTNAVALASGKEATVELPVGEYTLMVRAKDANKNVVRDDLRVRVIEPPKNETLSVEIVEPLELVGLLSLEGGVFGTISTDAFGDIVDYRWEIDGIIQSDNSSELDISLGAGWHTVSVIVTDSEGYQARDVVYVDGGEDLSGVQFVSDTLIKPNARENEPYNDSLTGDVDNPYGNGLTYLKSSGPAWLDISPNGELSGTPGAADVGSNEFIVMVQGPNGSDTATLIIEVERAFTFDGIQISPRFFVMEIAPETLASIDLKAKDGAPGHSDFVWSTNGIELARGQEVQIKLPVGKHNIVLSATDIHGNTSTATREVKIYALPVRGVYEAGRDGYATVTFPAYETATTTSWSVNGINVGNTQSLTIDLPVGSHKIGWVGHDAFGMPVPDTFAVIVRPGPSNTDPYFVEATVLSTRIKARKKFEQDISDSAFDDDGDPLIFSIIDGPAWLDITEDGLLFGKPGKKDKGRNLFTVQVEDGHGGSATANLKIRIK